jgi:hypothetical protein
MIERSRRTKAVLSVALTLAALAGAAHGGLLRVGPAHADSSCTNTECQGAAFCRYMRQVNCGFYEDPSECTNTSCPRAPAP